MTDKEMTEGLGGEWHEPVGTEGLEAVTCIQGIAACGCFRDYEDCVDHAKFFHPGYSTMDGMNALMDLLLPAGWEVAFHETRKNKIKCRMKSLAAYYDCTADTKELALRGAVEDMLKTRADVKANL